MKLNRRKFLFGSAAVVSTAAIASLAHASLFSNQAMTINKVVGIITDRFTWVSPHDPALHQFAQAIMQRSPDQAGKFTGHSLTDALSHTNTEVNLRSYLSREFLAHTNAQSYYRGDFEGLKFMPLENDLG